MQDKTIDNALLALRKLGGSQGKLAEVLLEMRGVPLPAIQLQPMRRGEAAKLVMERLAHGPATLADLADIIEQDRPKLIRRYTLHRAYMALKRLEAKGKVDEGEGAWRAT